MLINPLAINLFSMYVSQRHRPSTWRRARKGARNVLVSSISQLAARRTTIEHVELYHQLALSENNANNENDGMHV